MRLFLSHWHWRWDACTLVAADEKTKTAERLDDAATLFSEIMGTPDKSIPQDLLDKSHCVVLVPA